MTQKPKLSVGDKVRVYTETGLFDGTVEYIFADRAPSIRVRHDDGVRQLTRDVFVQQCRKLRPKQKPEKERERAEAWGALDEKNNGGIYFGGAARFSAKRDSENLSRNFIHLLEVRPGEVVLGREELARAWEEAFGAGNVFKDAMPKLARALGLGKDKA